MSAFEIEVHEKLQMNSEDLRSWRIPVADLGQISRFGRINKRKILSILHEHVEEFQPYSIHQRYRVRVNKILEDDVRIRITEQGLLRFKIFVREGAPFIIESGVTKRKLLSF